ncbi:RebB family R body protein [Nisaea acidiphila]|uniref:RebB family R body protein n=1 Tax=Nisaea acidiphila TaxID=1862145 RepID=A0A9J7AM56_9PROT|nr:RebB family R body protein [Nisaea acidiphila]UUX48042.1 RebB family R body protein [Nisaea acidiphila]
MAETVNGQITDAVTQANVKVLGEAPAEAVGMSFQALSHAIGLAMENATSTQGGMQQVANTATSSICALIVEQAGK